MAIKKVASFLGCLCLATLAACASSKRQDSATASVPRNPHQNPANPNPDALPKGLIEWVEYVCSIPDPEARKQAIKDSEEQRGWTFTCPEAKPSQGR
jgi:hypothetical protein